MPCVRWSCVAVRSVSERRLVMASLAFTEFTAQPDPAVALKGL